MGSIGRRNLVSLILATVATALLPIAAARAEVDVNGPSPLRASSGKCWQADFATAQRPNASLKAKNGE